MTGQTELSFFIFAIFSSFFLYHRPSSLDLATFLRLLQQMVAFERHSLAVVCTGRM